MKNRKIICCIMLVNFFSYSIVAKNNRAEQHSVQNNVQKTDFSGLIEKEGFDFDAMEACMIGLGVEEKMTAKPPSWYMVWLRKIGTPLVIKLAALYEKITIFWRTHVSNRLL